MITNIKKSENEVTVEFDNRSEFKVTSDNGSAWDIADKLLSPRHDMTYTQYHVMLEMEDDVTEIIAVEYAS